MTANETIVEACARAAHEVNRAYCMAIGDTSGMPVHWDHASDWHRDSVLTGVRGALAGNTPEQSHLSWLETKAATGWRYGPVKDPERREHPCLVPYDDLSPAQRAKDELFLRVVWATAIALGVPAPVVPVVELFFPTRP